MSNLYDRFINWLNFGEAPINTNKIAPESANDNNLAAAFKELGRLREENAKLKESESKTNYWLEEAKMRAGYDTNVSFDVVFNELLEAANKCKEIDV